MSFYTYVILCSSK